MREETAALRSSWRVGFALLVGLGSVSVAGTSHADVEGEAPPVKAAPRFERWARSEIALRTGYGIPVGKATRDAADELNELIAGQVPLWVDVGARVDGHVAFGVYYSYGFGLVGSYIGEACDQLQTASDDASVDVSCHVRDQRIGLQLGYHFTPSEAFDPWIAAGIGHEFLNFKLSSASSSGGATTTIEADGMEYVNVQVGLDYRLGEHFFAGPFVAATITTYGERTSSCHGDCGIAGSTGGEVRYGATHSWLFFGLRGVTLF